MRHSFVGWNHQWYRKVIWHLKVFEIKTKLLKVKILTARTFLRKTERKHNMGGEKRKMEGMADKKIKMEEGRKEKIWRTVWSERRGRNTRKGIPKIEMERNR